MTINVEVKLRKGESFEKMLKRFSKKCKNQDIVKEHLEKVSFHRTKSQKRRDKIAKNKFLKEKYKKKFK